MRKNTFFILALLCALSLGGCKKQEAIDLSSLHTTEAVEKETLPASTEAPTEAVPETESTAPSSNFSLKTEMKTETVGGATVEYPAVTSMKDSELQEKVNALLRTNALAIADVHPDASLSVKATVEAANLKRITVTYSGEMTGTSSGAKHIFYANTVDLETAENLGLKNFSDPYTVAGYIASGDYKLAEASGNETSIRNELGASGRTIEYYYKLLQDADFTGGYTADENQTPASDWPQVFSYEKQGVVYVSLPVSDSLGGYVLIRYSPDNK